MNKEELLQMVGREEARQRGQISLIASENYASKAVREVSASLLTNKYAEGYSGKRYYAGNALIDEIEDFACAAAKKLFNTDYHVNVQPYSGSPANLAAYMSVLKPGDTVMALSLSHGGHLTHGHSVSLTGQLYNFVHYELDEATETLDYDAIEKLAEQHAPRLVMCGYTAYPRLIDFQRFSRIAQSVGARLLADISHVAGLIASGCHPSPFGYADIVTTTTHKTLRGPRGGMIFCKPELSKAVDRAVFPGIQGGPHEHVIAAKAMAFLEDATPEFDEYSQAILNNAQALGNALASRGVRLVSGGTDTHLLIADVRSFGLDGKTAQENLESVGIIANMNMIPFDPGTPTRPSGLRLGTPAVTTRGMGTSEMEELAGILVESLGGTTEPSSIRSRVSNLANTYPIPE